jgi:hypothetical protein
MRKKLMALLLGACMVFALAGCGEQAGGTNQEEEKHDLLDVAPLGEVKRRGNSLSVFSFKYK